METHLFKQPFSPTDSILLWIENLIKQRLCDVLGLYWCCFHSEFQIVIRWKLKHYSIFEEENIFNDGFYTQKCHFTFSAEDLWIQLILNTLITALLMSIFLFFLFFCPIKSKNAESFLKGKISFADGNPITYLEW